MISAYAEDNGRLLHIGPDAGSLQQAVWVDLHNPTREEEAATEAALGIGIPLREEMEEIEISSRLYFEDGAVFMTATLPANTDSDTKMSERVCAESASSTWLFRRVPWPLS